MENVVDITDILAITEIGDLLDLQKANASNFFGSLKSGKTLAESLRGIGIKSASELDLDTWIRLRSWRNRNFPDNVKIK